MSAHDTGADAVVVGGGVIGTSIAWRARQRGLHVVLVDPEPGRGASWMAAGMLAPVTEAHYGEEPLLGLNLASIARWPSFAAEVEAASGHEVGYRADGTLAVAVDDDDQRALADLHRYLVELGLASERLRPRACREREPLLAPVIRGGLWAPGDHQVDNRRLVGALTTAAAAAGVVFVREPGELLIDVGRVVGVRTPAGAIRAPQVVLAAGWWSGTVTGSEPWPQPPVRPVKGQILRLSRRAGLPFPEHTVRGLVHGRSVYLVPRADGELVVGATVEEQGPDRRVTAGAVDQLLRDAIELVPLVAELELTEAAAGLRPGTPDNGPLLGPTAVDGLLAACGHYRNGILLAPLTADVIADLLAGGGLADVARPFDPARFATEAVR